MRLAELTRLAGLSKPSVYRLMNTLEEFRLVSRGPGAGAYLPGPGLFQLADEGLERIDIRYLAGPELDELQRKTNETVHLALLEDGEVVYVDKRESTQTIRMCSAVGRRAPVHCTGLGKAMLAFLSPTRQAEILRRRGLKQFTENTLTSVKALQRELAEIRRRGYALDVEEHEPDICCVGAPVFDYSGRVVAAISVTMPAFRTNVNSLHSLGSDVLRAAQSVSWILGSVSGDGRGDQRETG